MTDSLTASLDNSHAPVQDTFNPPFWLASPHLQSVLPGMRVRQPWIAKRSRTLLAASQAQVLDCGDDVRLLGHHSSRERAGHEPAKDLAILLHGWEGSADSLYVLSLGAHLFAHGSDVFRLNMRDHGPTHHLNQDIFHSCLLDEMVGAVRAIQQQHPTRRITLVGFSLGGNFMLRIAARAPTAGIRLERAIGICPVLHPHSAMQKLERGPSLYEQYFIDKWKRSLRIKQQLFPQRHDFSAVMTQTGIRAMTEAMIGRHMDFPNLMAYLDGYAIVGNVLANLDVPSHIFCALDDPIIPPDDLQHLARTPQLHLNAIPRGGHCGFMDHIGAATWTDRQVARLMGIE